MNADPRLPQYSDPPTWLPQFIQRFYALWREHAIDYSNIEQTHGEWTPVLTFATPGDLTVAYTTQLGRWTKQGKLAYVNFSILTSTFTFTTAVGALEITGLPLLPANVTSYVPVGAFEFSGITKAGYTNFVTRAAAATGFLAIAAGGSAKADDTVNAADMPSGGTVLLRGSIFYRID